jgi:hypothetical protein
MITIHEELYSVFKVNASTNAMTSGITSAEKEIMDKILSNLSLNHDCELLKEGNRRKNMNDKR